MVDNLWLAALLGYSVGSIPFGYILAKGRGLDVRVQGSGNVGATNVTRLLGRGIGVMTFLLDGAKAWAVVYFFHLYGSKEAAVMAGFWVLVGHNFSLWLNFSGGKGVASMVGVVAALQSWLLIILLPLWVGVFLLTRMVSLASIVMVVAIPILWWLYGDRDFIGASLMMSLFIIICHKKNIIDLWHGDEYRFRL